MALSVSRKNQTDNNDHPGQRTSKKTRMFFLLIFRLFYERFFICQFESMLLPNINPNIENLTRQESTCSINNIPKRMIFIN